MRMSQNPGLLARFGKVETFWCLFGDEKNINEVCVCVHVCVYVTICINMLQFYDYSHIELRKAD